MISHCLNIVTLILQNKSRFG